MKAGFPLTKKNYRYLFENASDAMWVQDMQGYIVDANRAGERLTGFTRQELFSKNVSEFFNGENLVLAREVCRKLLCGEEISQPYELRLVKKDGTTGVMKMSTDLLVIGGEPKGFQHVARDVTEEKSTEEMLTKITNGSPIPSFMIDKQHTVTHWNTALESLSGISWQEILGTDMHWRAFYKEKRPSLADLIVDGASADEIGAFYQGKYKKTRLIAGAYEAEDFFPDLGDSGRWLLFTASPIRNGRGEITGAIETLQDVTEEKQLQENMRYYVQLITQAQEEERRRIARELHDEVASSLLLLTRSLDTGLPSDLPQQYQALEEKLEVLHSQAVAALEQLRRCAQDLRPSILDDLGLVAALEWMADDLENNRGIKAVVTLSGDERDLPAEMQLLLFRIAQEALNNVKRHAEASTVVVSLEFGDKSVIMNVKDDGKGFNVPSRLEDMASSGRLGVMGMAERARLWQGTLEIKSELGKGTRVVAELPLRD